MRALIPPVSGHLQWAHWSQRSGDLFLPLSTREQSVSLDLSSSMLLLAGLLSVTFFFFLSGWATNTLLCPFVQNPAHGGRVYAIRSQESTRGN